MEEELGRKNETGRKKIGVSVAAPQRTPPFVPIFL